MGSDGFGDDRETQSRAALRVLSVLPAFEQVTRVLCWESRTIIADGEDGMRPLSFEPARMGSTRHASTAKADALRCGLVRTGTFQPFVPPISMPWRLARATAQD